MCYTKHKNLSDNLSGLRVRIDSEKQNLIAVIGIWLARSVHNRELVTEDFILVRGEGTQKVR